MKGQFNLHPVVIVGAGPIGLTLALTLERAGIPCVLLEDDHKVCDGSRAIGMSRRTLEIWDSLDAIDEIIAKGLDWKGGRSFYKEHEILSFQMADDINLMYRPMFNIQQSFTEQFLVNKVNQRPLIDLRWQSRLINLHTQVMSLNYLLQPHKVITKLSLNTLLPVMALKALFDP
jgi:3-(3-hydroxy-phenyl)propionate hydroxylase